MRKIKLPQNIWLLLALPVVGAVGWVIGRLIGRQNIMLPEPAPVTEQRSGIADHGIEAPALVKGRNELPAGHALIDRPKGSSFFYVLLVPFLILIAAVIVLALYRLPVQSQASVAGGDPDSGKAALQAWGCGACHTIPGVTGATGKVGPALSELSNQSFIAGRLQNTPDNMIQWILHPQEVSPGVDMPDSPIPQQIARDMAAYLYSIK